MEKEPKVVGKGEKWIVYGFFAGTDALQIILDFTVYGEVANHFIDIIIGLILFGYGIFRKLWTGKKLLVLLATFIGEQIPFVNALPFWTLDVKNLFSGTITEDEKAAMEQERMLANSIDSPLNDGNGTRRPYNPNTEEQGNGEDGVETLNNRSNNRPIQNGIALPTGRPKTTPNRVPMTDIRRSNTN